MIIKKSCITCSNFNFLTHKCPCESFPVLNLHLKESWKILSKHSCEEYDQIKITVYNNIIEIDSSKLYILDIISKQYN